MLSNMTLVEHICSKGVSVPFHLRYIKILLRTWATAANAVGLHISRFRPSATIDQVWRLALLPRMTKLINFMQVAEREGRMRKN